MNKELELLLKKYNISEDLTAHLQEVLKVYDVFDKAHQSEHIISVTKKALELADITDHTLNYSIIATASVYHDTGLCDGRESHNIESYRLVKESTSLKRFFTDEQIDIIATACKEHTASLDYTPTSIYSKIVADADTTANFSLERMLRRAIQYRLSIVHESNHVLDLNTIFEESYNHILLKYGRGGYIKYYLQETIDSINLKDIEDRIEDKIYCKNLFDRIIREEENELNEKLAVEQN